MFLLYKSLPRQGGGLGLRRALASTTVRLAGIIVLGWLFSTQCRVKNGPDRDVRSCCFFLPPMSTVPAKHAFKKKKVDILG